MELTNNRRREVQRDSNLELYRIVVMLAIVAHHYVVNSGLMERINESGPMSFPSLFCCCSAAGARSESTASCSSPATSCAGRILPFENF